MPPKLERRKSLANTQLENSSNLTSPTKKLFSIPTHVRQWMDERRIQVPEPGDSLLEALVDGKLILSALHCHMEHKPSFPPSRYTRWQLIAAILMDAGIEITEYGLRRMLLGDEVMLKETLSVCYALYHPAEGLTIPMNMVPESQEMYPEMFGHIVNSSSDAEQFMDRLKLLLITENPKLADDDHAQTLALLEELSGQLQRVTRFEMHEKFLTMSFALLTAETQRIGEYLSTFVSANGRAKVFKTLILGRSDAMEDIQAQIMDLLLGDSTPPEILDFLHELLLEVSAPNNIVTMLERLIIPHTKQQDVIMECLKLLEAQQVTEADMGTAVEWMSQLAIKVLHGDVEDLPRDESGNVIDPKLVIDIEADALLLLLRLWTDYTSIFEATDGPGHIKGFLATDRGRHISCRQVVLSEISSVAFVSTDVYDLMIGALTHLFKHTHQRRILLRSLADLHTSNTNINVTQLVDIVLDRLPTVQCGIVEGDFLVQMGRHPLICDRFNTLTQKYVEMIQQILGTSPFLHTHACTVMANLSSALQEDVEFAEAIQLMVRSLLTDSEDHKHGALLLHCIAKIHHSCQPIGKQHIIDAVHFFVQVLIRRLEADLAERQGQAAAEAEAKRLDEEGTEQQEKSEVSESSPTSKRESRMNSQGAPTSDEDENDPRRKSRKESKNSAAGADDAPKDRFGEAIINFTVEGTDHRKTEEEKRFDSWLAALKRLCHELGIAFQKVKMKELDPPTPKAATPAGGASREGGTRAGSRNGEGEEAETEEERALRLRQEELVSAFGGALDIFNGPSDDVVHAQTFMTNSDDEFDTRKAMSVKDKSKIQLRRLAKRKMESWIKTTFVQPMLRKVFDKCAKRDFNRLIAQRGIIPPDHRNENLAKTAHENRLAQKRREEEERLEAERRAKDAARLARDRRNKAYLAKVRDQRVMDSTPDSPAYYTKALNGTRKKETELRKQLLLEEQKSIVELYRLAKMDRKAVEQFEEHKLKLLERHEREAEDEKRAALRGKLNEYFEMKQQQEDLKEQEKWEDEMQGEFDKRLRHARYLDKQKRKLEAWKVENAEREYEESLQPLDDTYSTQSEYMPPNKHPMYQPGSEQPSARSSNAGGSTPQARNGAGARRLPRVAQSTPHGNGAYSNRSNQSAYSQQSTARSMGRKPLPPLDDNNQQPSRPQSTPLEDTNSSIGAMSSNSRPAAQTPPPSASARSNTSDTPRNQRVSPRQSTKRAPDSQTATPEPEPIDDDEDRWLAGDGGTATPHKSESSRTTTPAASNQAAADTSAPATPIEGTTVL